MTALRKIHIFLIVLLWCILAALCQKTTSTSTEKYETHSYQPLTTDREVYLNGSAYIRLQSTISLRRHIGLSFRTCHGEELFSQHDRSNSQSNIALSVQDNRLKFSVTIGKRQFVSVLESYKSLVDNKWHTVDLIFRFGNLTMYLDGINSGESQLLANETYNSEILTNPELNKEGGILIVGSNFNGCILEGPSLLFGTNIGTSYDATFGPCPLSTEACNRSSMNPITSIRQDMVATKQPKMASTDYCFNDPCMRHGSCQSHSNRYECKCSARYTGKNCEVDLGPPCDRPSASGTGPCLNGAQCIEDAMGDYSCVCTAEFTGTHCESIIEINPLCESHPCINNGTCTVSPNKSEYHCICIDGFTGDHCEINVNECLSNPCKNNGQCIDGINNYTCNCDNTGYTGPTCELDIDECDTNPCINQGYCFNYYGTYVCHCRNGFYGKNCENVLNECALNPCKNNGRCENDAESYKCLCLPGYTGLNCEAKVAFPCTKGITGDCPQYAECLELGGIQQCVCKTGFPKPPEGLTANCTENQLCKNNPCMNLGTCISLGESYQCVCRPGFTGKQCQQEINKCLTNPCKNGGICKESSSGNGFNCTCTELWAGATCEIPIINICQTHNPCTNNGTCIVDPNSLIQYTCKCVEGFTGVRCETNINDCESPDALCPENHICVDGINSFECVCPVGFKGDNCSIKVDSCEVPGTCNNGTCQKVDDSYECNCTNTGSTGKHCEVDIDECSVYPSICNNGICKNLIGAGFECYCRPGYTGYQCEQDFDECLSHPCKNGATCLNLVNNYECECPPGYTSKDCNIEIDECLSNPCANGSTCVDGIASFTCECPAGLSGPLCELDINECLSSPCLNNGKCIDGINSYTCDCDNTGFRGTHCDENIDDCLSNPCTSGASCIDQILDYKCACYAGYTGKNCEIDIDECLSSPCKHGGTCLQKSNITLYDRTFQESLNFSLSKTFENEFNYSNSDGYECICVLGTTGKNCEIDINECDSNPCYNGLCTDHVGYYTCGCEDGFEGPRCEININECVKYTPCVHGTCSDRRADYYCDCVPGYGGKNCSVELTGCMQEGTCLNNGTCKPYLENETIHKFNCSCTNGFHGPICENVTTMSLEGSSYVLVNTTRDEGYDIQFRFKTTLANGLLAIGKGVTFYILELVSGRLNLHSSLLNKWEGVFIGSTLNDGKWQKVFVAINSSHLVLSANEEQTIYPINLNEGANASHTSFPTTYLGGTIPNLRQLTHGDPFFVGCAEDVVINGEWVLPELNPLTIGGPVELQNIKVGCPREPQCEPNPCHSGGHCTDRWVSFNCSCERPYIGHTCQYNYTAATFGHENITNSLVTVQVTESARRAVRYVAHISMFIRTRQNKGQIFCLGSAITASNLMDKTYIAAELEGGELLLRIQFNGTPESYVVSAGVKKLDNGDNHLIEISRNLTLVQVKLNGTEYFRKTISATGPLDVQTLYLGGLPQISRPVRQADMEIGSQTSASQPKLNLGVANFKGIIQDVQISNGTRTMIVEFFPLKADDLEVPNSFGDVFYENGTILEGVVSDDMCRINPCQNNGTCYNTWNDFNCNCTIGYKGKICNEMEFCQLQDCPSGSICRNLDNGYECIANVTFDGKKPPLEYKFVNLNNTPDVVFEQMEINYRSNKSGTILLIMNGVDYFILSINKDSVLVQWSIKNQNEQHVFSKGNSDGDWTTIKFQFKDNIIKGGFSKDFMEDSPKFTVEHFDNESFYKMIMNSNIIIGGGLSNYDKENLIDLSGFKFNNTSYNVQSSIYATTENILISNSVDIPTSAAVTETPPLQMSEFGENYKGCVGEIRIGEYLLAYFTVSELNASNINELNHFELKKPIDHIGCLLCFDGDCQNGGVCMNALNEYICKCPPGFESDDCSIDIDECVDNRCQNNSTCIDGIANYTCDCKIGYEGWLCDQDINECLSNPCQNGGTCLDQLGYYQCVCEKAYTGTNCEVPPLITCSNNPCKNHSKCIDEKNKKTGNNFTCECATGFVGDFCDIPYCEETKCENRGNCTIVENKPPVCVCVRGFTGKYCETNIDDCILATGESPCQHNGICIDGIDEYTCNCNGTGYKGLLCEHDIDECKQFASSYLCGENGECINFNGGYKCKCPSGLCGRKCAFTDPCYNSFTISQNNKNNINHDMDIDIHTTVDEDEYKFYHLCGQHGKCVETCDLEPSYRCDCFDGYQGDNCTSIEGKLEHSASSVDIALIVIPIIVVLLIMAAGGLAILIAMARSKRATRGTYSPSAQEFCNPRVEMDHVLKPPPEERLI